MYLRHFALTRLPFETPAHTDELFDSNSRREAETRLNHLIELRGIGLLTERAHAVSLIHPLILLSNDTKDSLEYPLLHKHLQKPLHQWTDSLIRPVGNMVIQHQPLTKQRVRTIFHRVRL